MHAKPQKNKNSKEPKEKKHKDGIKYPFCPHSTGTTHKHHSLSCKHVSHLKFSCDLFWVLGGEKELAFMGENAKGFIFFYGKGRPFFLGVR